MIRRRIKFIILLLTMVLSFAGCAGSGREIDIAGRTYIYEKDGIGGDFIITINKDGTFFYCEGALSSYLGFGSWTLEGDMLLLSDNAQMAGNSRVNYFKVDGNDLVFLSENSTNFIYVKVADGERFSENPEEP